MSVNNNERYPQLLSCDLTMSVISIGNEVIDSIPIPLWSAETFRIEGSVKV